MERFPIVTYYSNSKVRWLTPYTDNIKSLVEYAKYNEKINVKFVDLISNPTLSQQYSNSSVDVNDIVVECGENVQVLTAYDLFNIPNRNAPVAHKATKALKPA